MGIVASVLTAITIGTVGALTLFTQTLPAVSTSSALTSNCSTTNASILSFVVQYHCGSSLPAFNATSTHIFNPSFVLPAAFTSLAVSNASACTGQIPLTNGGNTTLTTAGYYYCANYTNAPATFPSFTVTWSQ